MDKDFARSLLFFVNDTKTYEDFLSVVKKREEYRKDELAIAPTHEDMLIHQGAIRELRFLMKLREEVLQKAK